MRCVYMVRGKKKKHILFHILYITKLIVLRSEVWEALIGQLSSALWLAKYLKRLTEMLRPLPCCDAVFRRDET